MIPNNLTRLATLLFAALALLSGCGSPEKLKKEKLELGKTALAEGKLEEAREAFEIVYQLDITNIECLKGLAEIFRQQGRLRHGYQVLTRHLELSQDDLWIHTELGWTYLRAGQPENAAGKALHVLERDPENRDALIILAESSGASAPVAQSAINRIAGLPPEQAETPLKNLAYGIIFSKLPKYYGRSENFLGKAIAELPNESYAYLKRALLLWSQQRNQEAEADFKKAIELAPRSPEYVLEYANFLKKTERMEDALEALEASNAIATDYFPTQIETATLCLDLKKYERGLQITDSILKVDRLHPGALLLDARLKIANKQVKDAISALQFLVANYPKSSAAQMQLGLAYLADNQPSRAVESLNMARALGSESTEINILIAGASLTQADLSSAIIELKSYVGRNPQDWKVWVFLADTQRYNGDYEGALRSFAHIEQTFGKNPDLSFRIGMVQLQQKDYAAAQRSFEESLIMSKALPDPFYEPLEQLVLMDVAFNRKAAAIRRIDEFGYESPIGYKIHTLRGSVLLHFKDSDAAAESFQKAIELKGDEQRPYLMLADIYIAGRKLDSALDLLKNVIEFDPENIAARMQMGTIYEMNEQRELSSEQFERVLKTDPENVPALNNLAYLYCNYLDQPSKAFEYANKARLLQPHDPIVADTLGWVLYHQRNFLWAKPLIEEASIKAPREPEIQYHLGKVLYMMGEAEKALRPFQIASEAGAQFLGSEDCKMRIEALRIANIADAAERERLYALQLQRDPDDPIAALELAKSEYARGDSPSALARIERIIDHNKDNAHALIQKAIIVRDSGDEDSAYAIAKKAYAINQNDLTILRALGMLAFNKRQFGWASALLGRVTPKIADDFTLQFAYARASLAAGNLRSTSEAAKRSVELDPSNEDAAKFLEITGMIYDGGDAKERIEFASTMLKDAPDYLPALLLKATNEEAIGRVTDATATYASIVAAYPDCDLAKSRLAILMGEEEKTEVFGSSLL